MYAGAGLRQRDLGRALPAGEAGRFPSEVNVLVIALGPAKQVERTGTRIVGCTVSESDLMIASVAPMQIVPLHKAGLGVSMLIDLQSPTLLDVLGDDLGAPDDTVAWLLGRNLEAVVPPDHLGQRPALTLVGRPDLTIR